MQPEGIAQLIEIKRFNFKSGTGVYQVRDEGNADYAMYEVSGKEVLVGYVSSYGYYFKVTLPIAGTTLTKEIAYSEITIAR